MHRPHYLLRLVLLLLAFVLAPFPSRAASAPSAVWGTDQAVSVLAAADSSLYVGGSFYNLAPRFSSFVALDAQTGAADPAIPLLGDNITALVADGLGGWYLGSQVDSDISIRSQLLHIRADKTLDLTWHPQFDGRISTLMLVGNTLYVGGKFTTIDGQPHSSLAAIDVSAGALIAWEPNVHCDYLICVYALAVMSNTLFIGGDFTSFDGQPRRSIAAIDLTSRMLTSWHVDAEGTVRSLVASGQILYVGGVFQTIGGQARQNLAALDLITGAVTPWNPNPDWWVDVLALSDNTIWVGGQFGSIGGQNRSHVAEIDLATGNATAWNHNPYGWPNACQVSSLLIAGDTVYVACNALLALDSTTAQSTPWTVNANVSGTINTLTSNGATIFAGGHLISAGAVGHFSLANIDTTTGTPRAWDPGVVDPIYPTALATTGNEVYVGGLDPNADPHSSNGELISALDTADIPNAFWRIHANSSALAILVSKNTVYIGGWFTMIGGQPRKYLAALDSATGVVTPWDLNIDDSAGGSGVFALTLSGNTLYIGGRFTAIGGQARNNLAAVDITTGQLTGWNPVANAPVRSLAVDQGIIYAGGEFTTIGGQTHAYVAAIDDLGGSLAWNPDVDNTITSVAVSNGAVYIAGDFTRVNGQPRQRLAALNASTGATLPWYADANDRVAALAVLGDRIYIGGEFTKIEGVPESHLAERLAAQIPHFTQRAQLSLIMH